MFAFLRKMPFWMVTLVCAWLGGAACAGMTVDPSAPAGFEQLREPRPTAITLYYGGDVLGTFPAHYAPGEVRFDQPREIVKALPNLLKPGIVLAALKSPLPANARFLCHAKSSRDCGRLEPQVAGIIFDENRLRADLFLHPAVVSVTPSGTERFLPLPERNPASVYGWSGAVSGSDETNRFSFSNNAVFSYGEYRLNTQTTAANDGLRFDTASFDREREGKGYSAGLFRSQPMQLIPDRDMAGLAAFTSTRTLLDSRKTEGNDIILYLPRRSFVSIFREGRLISSRAYEAGNQTIDTGELPEGAYNITLRIQESGGITREERRFFAKTQEIPPPGKPFYYAQAGVIRKTAEADSTVPELTDYPIIRLGSTSRIGDNSGLSVSALGVSGRMLMESGIFWLREKSQWRATGLASTAGDFGIQGNYLFTGERMTAVLDARQVWMVDAHMRGYEDIARDIAQLSGTIAYLATQEVTLGARASYARESGGLQERFVYGPYAEWRLWQSGESMLSASADMVRADGGNEGNLLLLFTKRFGKYGLTASGGTGFGDSNAGAQGSAHLWHDNEELDNHVILDAGATYENHRPIVSGDADWSSNFGQMNASVLQAFSDEGSEFNYGGTFAVNAAQLKREFHIGGRQNDRSAVIVHTEGDAPGRMKIFINALERGRVVNGKEQVIFLTPFHTYAIRLAPEKKGLIDYDSNERRFTLYPGNVVKLDWQVNTFQVLVARMVLPDGAPLANAALQGSKMQAVTDGNGWLQAEISHPNGLIFTYSGNARCKATLPGSVAPVNGVLMHRAPIPCEPFSRNSAE